jgi:hypothetical protein
MTITGTCYISTYMPDTDITIDTKPLDTQDSAQWLMIQASDDADAIVAYSLYYASKYFADFDSDTTDVAVYTGTPDAFDSDMIVDTTSRTVDVNTVTH